MTIQDNSAPNNKTGEPDIQVPIAFASVVDEKPGYGNAYATATAPTASPDNYSRSNNNDASIAVPGYEPSATPIITASNTTTTAAPKPQATVVTPPPVPPVGNAYGAIPPGAPPGGQWVRVKYTGGNTWGIIGGTGCVLFWCCAMVLAPCALFGLLCPCDEKRAYMSPSGVIYDETGKAMGDRRRNKYTVISKA